MKDLDLDLRSYMSQHASDTQQHLYSLYGVCHHEGTLSQSNFFNLTKAKQFPPILSPRTCYRGHADSSCLMPCGSSPAVLEPSVGSVGCVGWFNSIQVLQISLTMAMTIEATQSLSQLQSSLTLWLSL